MNNTDFNNARFGFKEQVHIIEDRRPRSKIILIRIQFWKTT